MKYFLFQNVNKFAYICVMKSLMNKYKGIHPGVVLDRELLKRGLKQRPFAISIGEHPQTFNAILKGRRNLPTALALKIEKELSLKEGDLVMLQAYFDIEKEKSKFIHETPNLEIIRKILFWDTDFQKIDWQKNYKAVIKRVFERGNEEERKEITRFYGKKKLEQVLSSSSTLPINLSKV